MSDGAAQPLVVVKDLGRRGERNGNQWLVRHVSFTLHEGEVLAIEGPTGAGKSVLLRAIAALDTRDEGDVYLLGRSQDAWEITAYRSRMMYVHQTPALLPGPVADSLKSPFGFRVHHQQRTFDAERATRLLELLDGGGRLLQRTTGDLSGGERQVVALIRGLLLEPRVLLLDEPTAALDPKTTLAVERLIDGWLHEHAGRAVVWVTHNDAQATRIGTERLVLAL